MPEGLERLQRAEEQTERDFSVLDEIRAFKDVPDQELEREVQKALASARKELLRKGSRRRRDDRNLLLYGR